MAPVAMMTVSLAPVVMLPDVRVRVLATVVLRFSDTPFALLIVSELNEGAALPPIVWAVPPFSVYVPVLLLKVALSTKFPCTTWLKVDALKVVPLPITKLESTVMTLPSEGTCALPLALSSPAPAARW